LEESLENILLLCKKKDRKAQESIYTMYSSVLFSICLRYSDSYEDAQDIFQEGFVIIFNKINQYNFSGSFEGWIKKIMVNLCLEKYRKKTIYNHTIDEEVINIEEDDSDDSEFDFDYNILLEIIQTLSTQYRQVFNLYIIEGYSHQEIAQLLNISIGTSKSNLSRARSILKDKLTEYKASNVNE